MTKHPGRRTWSGGSTPKLNFFVFIWKHVNDFHFVILIFNANDENDLKKFVKSPAHIDVQTGWKSADALKRRERDAEGSVPLPIWATARKIIRNFTLYVMPLTNVIMTSNHVLFEVLIFAHRRTTNIFKLPMTLETWETNFSIELQKVWTNYVCR